MFWPKKISIFITWVTSKLSLMPEPFKVRVRKFDRYLTLTQQKKRPTTESNRVGPIRFFDWVNSFYHCLWIYWDRTVRVSCGKVSRWLKKMEKKRDDGIWVDGWGKWKGIRIENRKGLCGSWSLTFSDKIINVNDVASFLF